MLDCVADTNDTIIVKRDGTDKNVALIAETDLSSLLETVYLLRLQPTQLDWIGRSIEPNKEISKATNIQI
ncbi:hypothetical protein [Chamaesiphon sp. VAR_48_metabat_135_sub]|uniref:hypothetical protein n=1 Tax=Chamaesiphon sp. VAR_48_metabat_135_sub TaxID=2964699 RepID=UPI00286B4988|nr:hypothetical protein [Chamaesiphon sp. VAR_48_metabat_135_sub]